MYNVICNNIWPLKTIILNTLDSYVDRFRYSSIFSVYRSIPDVSNMRTSDTWQWKHENQECQSHLSREKKVQMLRGKFRTVKRTFSPPFSGFPRSQITLSSKLHCTSWSWNMVRVNLAIQIQRPETNPCITKDLQSSYWIKIKPWNLN